MTTLAEETGYLLGGADSPLTQTDAGEEVLHIGRLRRKRRWLSLPTADGADERRVSVRGNLPLALMLEMYGLERFLSGIRVDPVTGEETKGEEPDDEAASVQIREFEQQLEAIVREDNPGIEDDFALRLSAQEALAVLAFLSGNRNMTQAFINTLTAGGGDKPDVASDDAHAIARAGGLEDDLEEGRGGDEAPLASEKRSSGRSSASARSTTGKRSGGSTPAARGKRSGRTSPTRSAGSASASATD